jgi:POLQ-like helicase
MPDVCEALTYCCSPELIPLMKLPNIRLPRARILFNAGFMKIIEIAQIEDPRDLISRLPEKTMNIGQAKALIRDARYLIKEEKDELEMKVTEMKVPDDLNSEDNFNCSNFSIFTEEQQE